MRMAESVLLTCCPPAPEARKGIDPNIVVLDFDLEVTLYFGVDIDRGKRSVTAVVGIEW